jgi:hypothetical protein
MDAANPVHSVAPELDMWDSIAEEFIADVERLDAEMRVPSPRLEVRLLDHSDCISKSWDTEEGHREAMYYFEHHLGVTKRSHPWMAVRGALQRFYSQDKGTTFGEALQYAKDLFATEASLLAMGFRRRAVEWWISQRGVPSVEAGIKHLSKTPKQLHEDLDAFLKDEAQKRTLPRV